MSKITDKIDRAHTRWHEMGDQLFWMDRVAEVLKDISAKVEALEKDKRDNAEASPSPPGTMRLGESLDSLTQELQELTQTERQEQGAFYADWSKKFDVWWAKRTVPDDETPLDANVKLGWASVGFEAGAQVYAAELSRLRDLVRWRYAEKEKPEAGESVVVKTNGLTYGFVAWLDCYGEWWSFHGSDNPSQAFPPVRYWLPLPPLPKETK